MDVVKWEDVDEVVRGLVFPCMDQAFCLEGDVLVGSDAALRVGGCSRGIDHERATFWVVEWRELWNLCRCGGSRERQEAQEVAFGVGFVLAQLCLEFLKCRVDND